MIKTGQHTSATLGRLGVSGLADLAHPLKVTWQDLGVKRRVSNLPYFLHYTPSLSGGVASFIGNFSKAFPEYQHIVICARGLTDRAVESLKLPNLLMVGYRSHPAAVRLLRTLPAPVALVNHNFWDLAPLTKADIQADRVPVFAILHGHDARLNCEPTAVDTIVAWSAFFNEVYINLPKEVPLKVLPLGVDESRFAEIRPSVPKSKLVVGGITNGAPWKHSEDFVHLCGQIKEAIPSAQFVLLGARDLESEAKGLDYIQILAPYSISVPNYLATIHILLHKTRSDFRETWGLVVVESMCAGIPVVAEAKGGTKDQIIDGETGFLCTSNEDFVRACKGLYEDPELYLKISARARSYANSHFSLKEFRRHFEELLNG